MRAILCREYGAPEQLTLEDLPIPEVGEHEILVSVKGAGLNFADLVFLKGAYQGQPKAPFIPGIEVFGEVAVCGKAVAGFHVGDLVLGQVPAGGYAEYVAMNPQTTVHLTVDMPTAEAAGFYVNYGTAYSALVQRGNAKSGECALILGASGGVGIAAVQIAKALGLRVIADCRGEAKQALARQQGADLVIDHQSDDFRDTVQTFTNGRGCDVILDMIGDSATKAALKVVGFCGRLIIIGFAGGRPYTFPANHVLVKNASVIGHWWGDYSTRDRAQLVAAFEQLFSLYRRKLVKTVFSDILSLEQIPEGLQRYADRNVLSKLVALPHLATGGNISSDRKPTPRTAGSDERQPRLQ